MTFFPALEKWRSLVVLSALAMATAADAAAAEGPAWEWSPSALLYLLRDEANFVQPTLTVDRGALRLEGRYNYEALRTGSIFVGWNLSFGERLKLELTPMFGGVFGRRIGVAPGLTVTLEWGPLALWSQSEYVLDLADLSESFFYDWSELSGTIGWLRAGVALQRTRVVRTPTEVQVGPLLGVSMWKLAATVYVFAPGRAEQFVVVGMSASF